MTTLDLPRWASVPEAHDYLVSDEGRVIRLLPDGALRPIRACRNSKGYLKVDLWTADLDGRRVRRQEYVHRLVMAAFVGPCPDEHEVDHGDHNRTNNALWNLTYRPADENRWDWQAGWADEYERQAAQ